MGEGLWENRDRNVSLEGAGLLHLLPLLSQPGDLPTKPALGLGLREARRTMGGRESVGTTRDKRQSLESVPGTGKGLLTAQRGGLGASRAGFPASRAVFVRAQARTS